MLDVDRELSAQYLAAVAREFENRGLHVEASVLTDQSRGGKVVFTSPGNPHADRQLPLCAEWDGGRRWTVFTGIPAGGVHTRRARLHLPHLPTPIEVAEFVAAFIPEHVPVG
jgi:hypothetical protein